MAKNRARPTVDKQSITNEKAIGIVKEMLASHWLVRPRMPDYHTDYDLELINAGEPSGTIIHVQQKGRIDTKFRDGQASVSIKKKHLHYYSDRLPIPVFLFLINVTTRKGYWMFVQEWIGANPESLSKDQEYITLKVPENQELCDFPLFLNAVNRSLVYMRNKYPGSVEAAAKREVEHWTSFDRRFNVKLYLADGKKSYALIPREPVSFGLVPLAGAAAKLADFEKYGRPATVTSGEVQFTGLPIVDQLQLAGFTTHLQLKRANAKACELAMSVEVNGTAYRLVLKGTLTNGSHGILFVGSSDCGLVNVECIFTSPLNETQSGSLNVSFDFSGWQGKPISRLPYFESLNAFAESSERAIPITQQFLYEGQIFGTASVKTHAAGGPFSKVLWTTRLIRYARELATHFAVEPTLPVLDTVTEEQWKDIHIGHAVFIESGYTARVRSFRLSFPFDGEPEKLRRLANHKNGGEAKVWEPAGHLQLFDIKVAHGPTEKSIDPAIIEVTPEAFAKFKSGACDHIAGAIIAVGEAKYSIKRVEKMPPT